MSIIDTVTSLIAPHECIMCGREGSALCRSCSAVAGEPVAPRCTGCRSLSEGFRTCKVCRSWLHSYAIYVAVPYEATYEHLVHTYKFNLQRSAATAMAELMYEVSKEVLSSIDFITYIPTAPGRIRNRGFDHMKLLAKEYAKLANTEVVISLERSSNVRQLGASRRKRLEQAADMFSLRHDLILDNKTVLLLDDVMTTGASMAAASLLLKQAGARRVYGCVFAQGT